MISDLWFIVRMMVVTTLVMVFMQVKVGEETIDTTFKNFLTDSMFVGALQKSVDGFLAATKDGYLAMHKNLGGVLGKISRKPIPEGDSRKDFFKLKRFESEIEDKVDEITKELPEAKKAPSVEL